jgi:hypothetical protein
MSRRDLTAEIRASSTPVPSELRTRVQLLAASAPAPPRRVTWRRALVVALPVAAAVAAGVVLTRPSHQSAKTLTRLQVPALRAAKSPPAGESTVPGSQFKASGVAPSPTRLQRYAASLTLHEPTGAALSDATRRSQAIAVSLGGYANAVDVFDGTAHLVLSVPRAHVQDALARIARLGTITAEQVHVQDLQSGVAAGDRTIARLQRQLRMLRAEPPSPALTRRIAQVTARIAALQRHQAATRRAAHFAQVNVTLSSRAAAVHRGGHGPLHGLGVAFRWAGIGLVYVLALGGPVVAVLFAGRFAVHRLRRRREDELLGRT